MNARPRRAATLRVLLVGALAGVIISTGPPGFADDQADQPTKARGDWSQFRFGARHLGVSRAETILNPHNVDDLGKAWSTPISEAMHASPAVVGDLVYVGSLDGQLHAADRDTGKVLWSHPEDALTGDTVWTSPAVGHGRVFFAANRPSSVVYALDAETGEELWTHSYLHIVVASPVLVGAVVIFAYNDGTIHAFDAATGATQWTTTVRSGPYASPAAADGRLFVSVHNLGLVALDLDSGEELWTAPIPGPQWSSPAVKGDVVYVGSRDDHTVYAFDVETGDERWHRVTSAWVHTSPAVARRRVYVGNEAGDVYALRARTGRVVWRTRLDAGVFGGLTIANGVAYATTGLGDGKLVALDASTGVVLFSDVVGDGDGSGDGEWVVASPTVSDGAVYVGSYEGDAVLTRFDLDQH